MSRRGEGGKKEQNTTKITRPMRRRRRRNSRVEKLTYFSMQLGINCSKKLE